MVPSVAASCLEVAALERALAVTVLGEDVLARAIAAVPLSHRQHCVVGNLGAGSAAVDVGDVAHETLGVAANVGVRVVLDLVLVRVGDGSKVLDVVGLGALDTVDYIGSSDGR
ncbi:hypothetical protein PFISCL1PPCAC_25648 [Pristionchus fissidentatus]|uniref:Uncharacterized protein n=1 Tax=Pristionchus fissidentatus TaxID=1538716 RepID=A0AAV5WPY5_9BILA|nr:hypothetical protein PFISCL1PPCAC_25648 [Pristionchus fissidentatus]